MVIGWYFFVTERWVYLLRVKTKKTGYSGAELRMKLVSFDRMQSSQEKLHFFD
jgi:hypothetical protein